MNLISKFKQKMKEKKEIEKQPIVWHRGIKEKISTSFNFKVFPYVEVHESYNNLIHKKARVLDYFIDKGIIKVDVKSIGDNESENTFTIEIIKEIEK